MLSQEELAPRRWAARLAPEDLPDFAGFELGRVYQAGTGLMAGDFYDVFRVAPTRIAAVIGDVTGHGIEPSITAFQAKYLLRVFLRQYRDPAQALEELNRQMSALERVEEFISICVVVFDTEAATLRVASAGHPAAWLWHDREVRPLRATGPLLMLDPDGEYTSREIPLDVGDLLLLYTDGLAEARAGEQLFGEDRVANTLRRDPGVPPDVLCKSLLEAARDFATEPMTDDVAILAIRRGRSVPMDPELLEARRAGAGRQPPQQAEKLARAGQALRPRPARPAARRGLVRGGRAARQHRRPTTCRPTAWSPASAGSTAARSCVVANDPTVKAGSWGARTVEKIVRAHRARAAPRAAGVLAGRLGRRPDHRPGASCSPAAAAPAGSSTTR